MQNAPRYAIPSRRIFEDPTQRRWVAFIGLSSGLLYYAAAVAAAYAGQSFLPLPNLEFLRHSGVVVGMLLVWLLPIIYFTALMLGSFRSVLMIGCSLLQRHEGPKLAGKPPSVGVIVPAFNEARVILKTVSALLKSHYPDLVIVIVDDGSTDDTYETCKRAFAGEPNVLVVTKPNGGKSDALNYGISLINREIVVALDADTVFPASTIAHLVEKFTSHDVAAVAGNAKVGKPGQ